MKMTVRKPTENEIKEMSQQPQWSKEPSKFNWEYDTKEICLIISGEASVTNTETNETISFKEGDLVIFEKGLKCLWNIKTTIKKFYKFE